MFLFVILIMFLILVDSLMFFDVEEGPGSREADVPPTAEGPMRPSILLEISRPVHGIIPGK